GFAGIGKITGVQVTGEVDILRVPCEPNHMTSQIGEPLTNGPADPLGGARDEHTLVSHCNSPASMASLLVSILLGTRCAKAHKSSYPIVPAAAATASTEGPPSPHSTTRDPT